MHQAGLRGLRPLAPYANVSGLSSCLLRKRSLKYRQNYNWRTQYHGKQSRHPRELQEVLCDDRDRNGRNVLLDVFEFLLDFRPCMVQRNAAVYDAHYGCRDGSDNAVVHAGDVQEQQGQYGNLPRRWPTVTVRSVAGT